MTKLAFNVSKRLTNEKAKFIRKNGYIPCVIYGEFLDKPISLKISKKDLSSLLALNSKGSIIPLNIGEETKNCVVKDLQRDYDGKVNHIDFQYVKENEVIKLSIPINFVGQNNLEIKRLLLQTFVPHIDVQGSVEKLPQNIEIDVSKMNFEDKIFAKDIQIPKDITLTTDPDILLALVTGSINTVV